MGLLRELLVALLLGRVLLQLSVLPGAATGTSSAEVGSHLVSMQEGVRQGGQLVAESANTRCICSHKKQHGEQQRGIEHRMATGKQPAGGSVPAQPHQAGWGNTAGCLPDPGYERTTLLRNCHATAARSLLL